MPGQNCPEYRARTRSSPFVVASCRDFLAADDRNGLYRILIGTGVAFISSASEPNDIADFLRSWESPPALRLISSTVFRRDLRVSDGSEICAMANVKSSAQRRFIAGSRCPTCRESVAVVAKEKRNKKTCDTAACFVQVGGSRARENVSHCENFAPPAESSRDSAVSRNAITN